MKRYLNRLELHRGRSLMGEAIHTAEYVGASFAYGYVQNRYRDKASVAGVPLDLGLGAALKLGSIVAHMAGFSGLLVDQADLVGSAGLAAHFHTVGAGLGAEKSGVTRVIADKKDVPKIKAAAPSSTVLGSIPRAAHGDLLSPAQLAHLAR